MLRLNVLGATIGLAAALAVSSGHAEDVTFAPAEPVTLEISEYALAPAGTVVTWRDLIDDKEIEEKVEAADGLMMKSRVDGRRRFAYLPDPWADNENTRQDDIKPLFPLAVGKSISFSRHPKAGLAHDTVTVLHTETLTLPIGKVDTYVIHTKSEIAMDGWVGEATFWYAPALDWYVQMEIKSTDDGDHRARQVIAFTKPGVE
jgi:hypothetical protein